MNIDIWRVY